VSARGRAWAWAGATAALVVALDQASKQIAVAALERGQSESVFFGLELTHVRNTGIAFGALSDGGALVIALIAAAVLLLVVYFARHAAEPGIWLPVGAVLGGALGNLADRSREGTVIDFIDPVIWPAFNVADLAIVAGVLGLLYVTGGPRRDRSGETSEKPRSGALP
jgi:signal peptidase II